MHVLLALAAWIVLTLASTIIHRLAWHPSGDLPAQQSIFGEHLCKLLCNLSQLAALPGWLVMWLGFGRFAGPYSAAAAYAIGWGCWAAGWIGVTALRRWLRTCRTPTAVLTRPDAAPSTVPTGPSASTPPPGTTLPEPVPASGPAEPSGQHRSRRGFLVDASLVSTALIGLAGTGAATLATPWALTVRRYRVPIRGLPKELSGLRIVQLTDTHLGPRISSDFIEEAVRLARSLKPDLFLLTGDYVHMGPQHIAPAAELFRPLTEPGAARLGVLGVLGNHDHYADGEAMSRALRGVGVTMIENTRVYLDAATRTISRAAPGGPSLCIAGVGDLLEGTVDVRAALGGVGRELPRLLLSHNPDVAELPAVAGDGISSFGPRIDLMISGHTHGGQVRLPVIGAPGVPSRYGQKYAQGLVEGPACRVLVSAGIGMSALPIRFGVPPEIVEIELVAATDP